VRDGIGDEIREDEQQESHADQYRAQHNPEALIPHTALSLPAFSPPLAEIEGDHGYPHHH